MESSCIKYKSATELLVDNTNTATNSLSGLSKIITQIQQTIYPVELVENISVFQHILSVSPGLCLFVTESSPQKTSDHEFSEVYGHLIAHPWPNSIYPPRLNLMVDITRIEPHQLGTEKQSHTRTDQQPQNIFLHDLTVIPQMANKGIGRELISRFLAHIYALNQPTIISLVSVRESQKFWEKLGFEPITNKSLLDDQQLEILKTYGDCTANIMQLVIHQQEIT